MNISKVNNLKEVMISIVPTHPSHASCFLRAVLSLMSLGHCSYLSSCKGLFALLLPMTDATLQSVFLCFITSDEKCRTKQSRYLEICKNIYRILFLYHNFQKRINIFYNNANHLLEWSSMVTQQWSDNVMILY